MNKVDTYLFQARQSHNCYAFILPHAGQKGAYSLRAKQRAAVSPPIGTDFGSASYRHQASVNLRTLIQLMKEKTD